MKPGRNPSGGRRGRPIEARCNVGPGPDYSWNRARGAILSGRGQWASASTGLQLSMVARYTSKKRELSAGTVHVSERLRSDDRSLRGSLLDLQSVMLYVVA